MKRALLFLFILLISQNLSYAIGEKDTMDKIMSSWKGESLDTVIDHWGYPTNEKTIAGKKLYYWEVSKYIINTNSQGVYGRELTCNRILEFDENNKVTKWQWNGNKCPGTYFRGKKYVNPNNDPWKKEE